MGVIADNVAGLSAAFDRGYAGSLRGCDAASSPAVVAAAAAPTECPPQRAVSPEGDRALRSAKSACAVLLQPARLHRVRNVPRRHAVSPAETAAAELQEPAAAAPSAFTALVTRTELASLATLASPCLMPPRQFCTQVLAHTDLRGYVQALTGEGRARSLACVLNLDTMPEDVLYHPNSEERAPYAATSGQPILLNSPRSVVVLLRAGVSVCDLQMRHGLKTEMERRHTEGKRVELLESLRTNYRRICMELGTQEVAEFFKHYNPAEPSALPDLDQEGEVEYLVKRLKPAQNSGPGLFCESAVCPGLAVSDDAPVSPLLPGDALPASSGAPVESPSGAVSVTRKMDFTPLVQKMQRDRRRMEAILTKDTQKRLEQLSEVQKEQDKKMHNMRQHREREQRRAVLQLQCVRLREEAALKKQSRRAANAQELEAVRNARLLEKEAREVSLQKRRSETTAILQSSRKERRETVKLRLQERVRAARSLEQHRVEQNRRLLEEKECVLDRVEERMRDVQMSLKEAGVARNKEAEESRQRIDAHFKREERAREERYEVKMNDSERRLAALAARKHLALTRKAEVEAEAAYLRQQKKDEQQRADDEAQAKASQSRRRRENQFVERKQELAQRKGEAALSNRLRTSDIQDAVRRTRSVDEYRALLVHHGVECQGDRVATLLSHVGVIQERTRRAREALYVLKESRARELHRISVKAEKAICCERED